jgi:hypothetical protein
MNELKTLAENLNLFNKYFLLFTARYFYLRRHPRLVPLYATVLSGPPLIFFYP